MTFEPGQAVIYRKLTSNSPRRAEVLQAERRDDADGYVIVIDGFQRWAFSDQLSSLLPAESVAAACAKPAGPVVELTEQGEQIVLPGAERSAAQAAASRPERIKAKRAQAALGGMFAVEAPQPTLF